MSTQVTPEAFFDSLSIAHKLDSFLDGFKLEEIHLFSYFSSFLYSFAGNAISSWEHKYIVVDNYPFSNSINDAILRHIQNGLFENKGDYYIITGRGTDEYNKFKSLSNFTKREKIINAACTTSILLPYSQTLRALLNEPDLKATQELDDKSWLDQSSYYDQFKKISEAVGIKANDLLIPAVTWINFLLEKTKQE